MENTQPEFNIDNYNDLLKKIKVGSPVHKINFSIENQNAVVGMFLISLSDVNTYLEKFADHDDLNEDTLLVFESRHVIECCQIIYGCLHILQDINALVYSNNFIINDIIKTLLTTPIVYKKALTELNRIARSSVKRDGSENSKKVYEALKYILQNIWFVPYNNIDEIANEAIEEFKKRYNGDDTNG